MRQVKFKEFWDIKFPPINQLCICIFSFKKYDIRFSLHSVSVILFYADLFWINVFSKISFFISNINIFNFPFQYLSQFIMILVAALKELVTLDLLLT